MADTRSRTGIAARPERHREQAARRGAASRREIEGAALRSTGDAGWPRGALLRRTAQPGLARVGEDAGSS
ncbi:MAG: hypothetical protein R3263_13210 [Myxococcota bacterium]|nr:hypothetical protein [Myxococcota bacterium]